MADVALKALLDHGRARPVGGCGVRGPWEGWGRGGEVDLTPPAVSRQVVLQVICVNCLYWNMAVLKIL